MVEFVPAAALLALIVKMVDFLRYAKARDVNGTVTQLVVWLAGVIVVLFVARTDWAKGIVIGGLSLHQMNAWSLIFAGVTVSSWGSLFKDTLKAVDNTNSAVIPTLLPSGPAAPPVPNPPASSAG